MIARKATQHLGIYLTLATLLFYNFHRYIFMYNSDGTSSTYSNTPVVWKVMKYVLILIFLGVYYLGAKFKFVFTRAFVYTYIMIFLIIIINVLNFLYYEEISFNELEYVYYFIIAIPLWFTEYDWDKLNINYDKIIKVSATVLFISNAIVIVNYLFLGRLPALGYEGGLVRFGAFWDDPNGFGFICVIFAYYFFFKKNFIFLAATLIAIFLTFSFTAYFMLFFSAVYWMFRYYRYINLKIIFLCIVASLVGIYEVVNYWDYFQELFESKSGSVNEHLNNELIFNPYPLAYTSIQFSETWYLSFFYNYFPFSIFGIIIFLGLLFWCLKGKSSFFLKYFIFNFLFYCLFLPMNYVFPLNFIFVAFLALNLKYKFKVKPLGRTYIGNRIN